MIKIKLFYPFQNLLRVSQEFYEDKAIVKTKSLSFEQVYEFNYKDVVEVIDAFKSEYSQITFSFYLLLAINFLLALFDKFIYSHQVLLRVGEALYLLGLLLFTTGFKRTWRIYFLDKNNNTLTSIKQTRQNREVIPQIIETVKNKAENPKEYSTADPFSEEEFVFEYVEYNLSDLSKTTERFYENEIIGYRQSPFGESTYNIMYNRLSGKVFHAKSNNDFGGWLFSMGVLLMSVYGGFVYGFALPYHIHISKLLFYIILGLFILSLISLPANFIKREVVGLHNINGNIEYSTYINRNNKDQVEKIIEFIQSKIPAENKK